MIKHMFSAFNGFVRVIAAFLGILEDWASVHRLQLNLGWVTEFGDKPRCLETL